MHKIKRESLEIHPDMPMELKAKLEFSSAVRLFNIASDLHLQYMTLIQSAWDDISPVVDWFVEQGRHQEGIDWLNENTPDVFLRTLAITRIINSGRSSK